MKLSNVCGVNHFFVYYKTFSCQQIFSQLYSDNKKKQRQRILS